MAATAATATAAIMAIRRGYPRGDRDHERHVEPDRDVDMLHLPNGDRPEEIHGENHPDQRDREIDRPDQLGILAGLRQAQGECECGGHDDQLPSPEMNLRQGIAPHARLQESLHGVVDAGEADIPRKGEDHGVGMQGPQTTEGGPGKSQVRGPPRQLEGDDDSDEHAHDPPQDRRDRELLDDVVIVDRGGHTGTRRSGFFHAIPRKIVWLRRSGQGHILM